MQKLHNTYWRNCHGFYSNYIHSKHDTRMFMANTPILPRVSYWQHIIHIQINQIRAGNLETTVIPPTNGYLSKSHKRQ